MEFINAETIGDLKLSYSAHQCLLRAGIRTVDELKTLTLKDLEKIFRFQWGIDRACMEEIIEIQKKLGVKIIENKEETKVSVEESLSTLELSNNTMKCLRKAGIKTITQFKKLNKEDLMKIRNLTNKSLKEIIKARKILESEIL